MRWLLCLLLVSLISGCELFDEDWIEYTDYMYGFSFMYPDFYTRSTEIDIHLAEPYGEPIITLVSDEMVWVIGSFRLLELLFSVELKYQIDLDKGDISEDLRQEFENNAISLSPKVAVSPEKEDSKWLITDKDKEKTYSVRKEKDKLNIYLSSGLEEESLDRMESEYLNRQTHGRWIQPPIKHQNPHARIVWLAEAETSEDAGIIAYIIAPNLFVYFLGVGSEAEVKDNLELVEEMLDTIRVF